MASPDSASTVRYVAVFTFTVERDDFEGFTRETTLFLARRGPTIPGLVQTIVMGSDEKTQVVVVSLWDSRESWSAAQWEEDVGRSVASFVESAKSFEVHSYERIAVIRGPA